MQELLFVSAGQVGKLAISFLLALPIGWDRELEDRSAGLRTFPLVSLGSCGLMQVGQALVPPSADVNSRVLQGLITGIGFVGGGAILKSEKSVRGTATAASIFNMAVIGAATAFGLYEIALVLVFFEFVTLRLLRHFKEELDRRS